MTTVMTMDVGTALVAMAQVLAMWKRDHARIKQETAALLIDIENPMRCRVSEKR